jgi:hypothetical protein
MPSLNSPSSSATGEVSVSSSVAGSRVDIMKSYTEGIRMKSPSCRVIGSCPSTARWHDPSRITQ